MSIHILNMLIELSEPSGTCYTLDTMKHALGHTDAGNHLDYNDYRALSTSRSIAEFQVIARILVPKYRRIHAFLGYPKNADAWTFAQLRTSPRDLLWEPTLPHPLYWRT